MPRRALLLGVDKYVDPGLQLGAPGNDIVAMSQTLATIGYPRDCIKVVKSSELTLSTPTLRREIRAFLRQCKADDEVLIYFSGHGVEQDGHRLWIPADYDPEEPPSPHELISDSHLYAVARDSEAWSVVYIVDACREGVKFSLVADKGLASRDAGLPGLTTENSPSVAIVFSCRKGEKAKAQANGLSYFTRALCEVLEMNDERSMLSEVVAATDEVLERLLLAASLKRHGAEIDERPIPGRGGDPTKLLIKENVAARLQQRMADSIWCRGLQEAVVWDRLRESESLGLQVLSLVLHAESLVADAGRALPNQRWRNRDYPLRVVEYLGMLTNGGATLSPPEAALAVAAPYVYEAMLANGELVLSRYGNPIVCSDVESPQNAGTPWLALRNALHSQEAFARRRALLVQHGRLEAAEDLAGWQLLRFLHLSGDVWEYPSSRRSGWSGGHGLAGVFEIAPFKQMRSDPVVSRLWSGSRLVRFARSVFQTFEDIELERGRGLDPELRVGSHGWHVDEPALAHLVALSAAMVVDPRRLSSMLADHLGMAELFTAERLKQLFGTIEWHRYGVEKYELGLCLECPHEVIDAALEDFVAELEGHRARLARETPLAAVPARFDLRGLKPKRDLDSRPLYHKPHLRLTQDEVKVRELLMGRELYGYEAVALRELYQNAMDACRYRRARVEWQYATGGEPGPYAGLIVFRAGYDENGRAYIECRDNGIGMAERHLQRQFARAGQRFTDSHEFHLEKARWEEAGIIFTPNSRFGIGVYSYFMMADEILVETRRLAENCVDSEQGLSAAVVGSGSLFRLRRAEAVPVGTRVRLYLNDSGYLDSLHDDVFEWLWIPEFAVRFEVANRPPVELPAGQPTRALSALKRELLPIPESAGTNGQPRLFWALSRDSVKSRSDDDRLVLSDGIRTKADSGRPLPGVLVNLTEEYRPELSVDRGRANDWQVGYRWARQLLAEHGWKYLLEYPGISVTELVDLTGPHLDVVMALDRHLRGLGGGSQRLRYFGSGKEDVSIDLAGLGLSEADLLIKEVLCNRFARQYYGNTPILAAAVGWRLSELAGAGLPLSPSLRKFAEFSALSKHDLSLGSIALVSYAERVGERLSEISLPHIISFAALHSLAIGEVIALARPLAGLGLAVPEVPPEASAFIPSDELARLFDLNLGVRSKRIGELTLGGVICASGAWGESLGQTLDRAKPLERLGYSLPSIPDELLGYTPDEEFDSISSDWRNMVGGIDDIIEAGKLSISNIVSISEATQCALGDTLIILRSLVGLGIAVPSLSEAVLALLTGNPVCKAVLATRLIDHFAMTDTSDEISLPQMVLAADQLSLPLGEAFEQCRPLEALGLRLPRLPEGFRDFTLDADLRRLVKSDFDGNLPCGSVVSRVQCVLASAEWSVTLGEVLVRARRLSILGFKLPEIDPDMAVHTIDERLVPFLGTCSEIDRVEEDRLTWQHLTSYADQSRFDYDSLAEFVRPLQMTGIDVELPRLEGFPLLQALSGEPTRCRWYTAYDLAVYCHREGIDPATQMGPLQALSDIGWDIENALAFSRHCAAQ
jgi:hypothetical protein